MRKLMGGIKSYIKKNWIFLFVMSIGILATCLLVSQVVNYADDYSLGSYSAEGIKGAFNYFCNNYVSWGGGYTSSIVIILMAMGPFFWRAALVIPMVLFVGLSVKLLCKNHPQQKWFAALILWCLMFIISIQVTREGIYWLDGGIAYLFSMFQAFLVLYIFYTRLVQKVSHKYDCILLPIISFFGGWSSAQSGGMAILISAIIVFWQHFYKKEKIKPIYYICIALTIIGFSIYYFAPGNYVRMEGFSEYIKYGFLGRIFYRANDVFGITFGAKAIDYTGTPFFVYLAISLIAFIDFLSIKQEKNHKIKTLRLYCSIYILSYVLTFLIGKLDIPIISHIAEAMFRYTDLTNIQYNGPISIIELFSYLAGIFAIIASTISAFLFCKREKNGDPLLLVIIITGFLANIAMLLAPHSPYRTTLYTISFMIIAIVYLLIHIKKTNTRMLPITLLIFGIINIKIFFILAIIYTFLSLFTKKKSQGIIDLTIFCILLFVFSGINYSQELINYHRNKIIYDQNFNLLIEAADKYSETGLAPDVIYLDRPYNAFYGYDNLADLEWTKRDVKAYVGLPNDVIIEYKGEQK